LKKITPPVKIEREKDRRQKFQERPAEHAEEFPAPGKDQMPHFVKSQVQRPKKTAVKGIPEKLEEKIAEPQNDRQPQKTVLLAAPCRRFDQKIFYFSSLVPSKNFFRK
jgi:hypothetical protein